jgi:PPM family protein phosphatase
MRIARASALTDVGRRRLGNEDAFVCDPPLFAVADGMGGAQAGELASQLAAAALEERSGGLRGEEGMTALVQDANARIFRRALADPTAAGMGTTVTAALVDEEDGAVTIAHVGDSRAYRLRGGRLEQLTDDHSLVAELVRSGRLTQEEADQHPHRSVITRALGTEEAVAVDTFTISMEPGDLYLICSDGLTSMVADDEILGLLTAAEGDLDRAAESLVAAANAGGGEDNVTVVLVAIEEGAPRDADTETSAPVDAATVAARPSDGGSADVAAIPDMVTRSGPSAGGRLPALVLILVLLALAALVVWWSVAR